jgi:phenylacetate-CoA ligase
MIEVLVNSRGEQVDPIYFIHLVGVVFNRGFVRKFQVVQEMDGGLTIPIVLEPGSTPESVAPNLDEVREKVRLVMGEDCRITFEFVLDIPLGPSGKHQYVVRRQSAVTAQGR